MPINDTEQFDSLFKENYPRLYYYARGMVGEADADDVCSEVFMELWRRRDELDLGDKATALLYRSVYTRSLNLLKRRGISASRISAIESISRQQLEFLVSPQNDNPVARIENDELRQEIEKAVAELPEKCQMCFRLSYMQDMHNDEIATALGLSVRTVEAHIYRALKVLRERLGKLTLAAISLLLFG